MNGKTRICVGRESMKAKCLEINEIAVQYYHSQLLGDNGCKGMECLKICGLDRDTIDKFGIGFAADLSGTGLIDHLKRLGYTDAEINDSGLFVKHNSRLAGRPETEYVDMFIDDIIIPIVNESGHTVGLYAQEIGGNGMDFFSATKPYSDLRKALFGINIAIRSNVDYLIACYGIMDAILMHQAGFDMTVSFPGIEEATFQAETIKKFTKKIILCMGSVEYETEWMKDVTDILERDGIRVERADISPHTDATELITKAGADEMAKRILAIAD